ncbi:MAG: hypothetical protein ACPL1F_01705, partial [bacterium]
LTFGCFSTLEDIKGGNISINNCNSLSISIVFYLPGYLFTAHLFPGIGGLFILHNHYVIYN